MRYELAKVDGGTVVTRDGVEVATVDKSSWRERATLEIEGRPWEFRKDGAEHRGAPAGGAVEVVARRRSFWSSAWEVTTGSATYELTRAGYWTSRLVVRRAGVEIGAICNRSTWTNSPVLDIDDTPVADAVFLVWIAFVVRGRAAAGA